MWDVLQGVTGDCRAREGGQMNGMSCEGQQGTAGLRTQINWMSCVGNREDCNTAGLGERQMYSMSCEGQQGTARLRRGDLAGPYSCSPPFLVLLFPVTPCRTSHIYRDRCHAMTCNGHICHITDVML